MDILRYPYELLTRPIEKDELRIGHYSDIAAMKVNAILNRGTKKDFWDIAELLDHMSLEKIIEQFEKMYPDNRLLISIPQALVYFDDAESSPNPVTLNSTSWEQVKSKLQKAVRDYLY